MMDSPEVAGDRGETAAIQALPLIPTTQTPSHRGSLLFLRLFVVWLAVCDLAIVPLTMYIRPHDAGAVLVFVTMGCFASQLGVLPTWLVWGYGRYWFRIAVGWGVAVLLGVVWAAGLMLGHAIFHRIVKYEDLAAILLWPLISLAIETPLWCLKTIFGARIVRLGAPPDRPLAIGDLLVAMAMTAIALTLARLGRFLVVDVSDAEYWGVIGVISGIGAAISLVLLPLLALVVTRIRSWVKSLMTTSLVVVVSGLALATTGYLSAGMPPIGYFGLCGVFLVGACFTATLAFPFWLARWAGYRLVFGRSAV